MTPLDLLGPWRLERTIEDRRGGERLRVEGTTVLGQDAPDRVTWVEQGTLHRTGRAPVAVTRTLHVVRRDARWWVCFDHGGDFHPWAVDEPVEHPCGADLYRGLVSGDPRGWRVVWRVSGPAKDYTTTSLLTPPGRAPGRGRDAT